MAQPHWIHEHTKPVPGFEASVRAEAERRYDELHDQDKSVLPRERWIGILIFEVRADLRAE